MMVPYVPGAEKTQILCLWVMEETMSQRKEIAILKQPAQVLWVDSSSLSQARLTSSRHLREPTGTAMTDH